MKNLNYVTKLLSLCICLMASVAMIAQGQIGGTVVDETGEALIGANIIVQGTTEGTVTDFDGTFSFNTTQSFPLTVVVSFTGYTSQDIALTGPTSNMDITLSEGVLLGDDVVISASRRREKIQEAPASVSVLTARKLEATPNDNAARAIINEPGVYVQQQGAGRVNIQLRGDGGIFGSATFPILDYRSLSGPGLGTFDNINSPLNNIDIERIEVVRGPGSALYGPGVTAGVVHFISKSPIDKPGTTIELIGGELSTFGGSLRHATKVSDKFGYKINAVLKRGGEFQYDLNNPIGASQIGLVQTTISAPAITNGIVDATQAGRVLLTNEDLDPDGNGNPIQDHWRSFVLNGTLEFRPQDDLSLVLSGGTNNGSAVFYNSQGVGLSQATETWVQGRVQKGGLFAQAFWLRNNGGTDENPTFLYQTGNTTGIDRTQLEAQLQYNFDTPSFLNANWTAGFDYRLSVADTENTVYGREEDDDDFGIIGGYIQTKLALGDKLDLVVAGRADRFNFLDQTAFSPRAVFVYKPSPKHTFRAGFNRAVAAPSQLQVNIDFPVNNIIPGSFDVWLVGNKNEQTFNDPILQWFTGAIPSTPLGAVNGLPLAVLLGAEAAPGVTLNQAVIGQLVAGLAANPATAGAAGLVGDILGQLNDPNAALGLGVGGQLSPGFNIFNGQPLGTLNAPAASLRVEDTWEIGYKGLIGDKLGLSIDVYNRNIDGATLFTGISPTYILFGADGAPGIGGIDGQLGSAVQNFAQPQIEAALLGLGLDAATAAATAGQLGAAINGAYTGGGGLAINTPSAAFGGASLAQVFAALPFHATTPTDQVPQNGVTHLAAGYRTFEEYSYWGSDIGLNYFVNNDLSFFANLSLTSENIFNPQIAGVDGTERTSISQPTNRYRIGWNLTPEYGWRANMAFQHDPTFPVFLGQQYSGDTDVKNLVDAGVGYKFDNGLSLSLTAQNLFDSEYRTFPNFPTIGRRVLGNLTYTFGAEGPSDVDGDGVKDKKDACPNEPGLKEFDGCADSDGDGIIDSEDNCPLAAGDILYGGCPDSDGDGVIDKDDACPNAAGPLGGCPDADGDGVADKDDSCPNAAGTLSGCPDGDGDGVADRDDACPNAAGPVNGCPDGDGDGVADKDDKCPTVAARTADGCPSDPDGDGVAGSADRCPNEGGIVDANGCPKDSDGDGVVDNDDKCPDVGGNVGPDGCIKAVPAKATEVFRRALTEVKFETGRGTITRASYGILDEVVGIMAEFPALTVSIEGHTDSRGNDDKNMTLSQTRAQAVMTYLTEKGVSATRLRSVGFGELVPIATNDTSAGRAQNRRVALIGSF